MSEWHDPVPDGKTGPWLREPHLKSWNGKLIWDERCRACNPQLPLEEPHEPSTA